MSHPPTDRPPSLAGAEWLTRPETQRLLEALEKDGIAAHVVGGAVRNALLGEPVKDIDIATTAQPEEVTRLATAAGLKAVPTGLEHGTVTVVVEHIPYEVTTLRRDIETFGRHARVAYTTDWAEDARRRDFTINALYCDAAGTVHDPLGVYSDLEKRRVRFIGDAHDRIREDYLRILRFFRFTAEYTNGDPDPVGIAASSELKDGLDKLSGERVRVEVLRLLQAPGAVRALDAMAKANILTCVLGDAADPSLLHRMAAIEDALDLSPDPLLRLGVLTLLRPGGALSLRDRLRLSNSEYERLARLALSDPAFDPQSPETAAQAFLYRHGAEAFRDGVLLAWARSNDAPDNEARRSRATLAERWTPPELPIRGADVLELGVKPGPDVGRIVSAFEDWWISAGFPMQPALIAKKLTTLVGTAPEQR